MTHIQGRQDNDLHHEDGSHRTTSASTSGHAIALHERRIRHHLSEHERPMVNNDPDKLDCYSDHAHDIMERGFCEFCGSDDVGTIGHILPHIERVKGWDPVKASAYVVEHGSATFVDGVLLDHFSASAVQAVAKSMKPENVEKLRTMPLTRAVSVCFKLIELAKA